MIPTEKECLCDVLGEDIEIFLSSDLREKMLRYSRKLNRERFSFDEEGLIRHCFKYKLSFLKNFFPEASEHVIFLNLNHYLYKGNCIFCDEGYKGS